MVRNGTLLSTFTNGILTNTDNLTYDYQESTNDIEISKEDTGCRQNVWYSGQMDDIRIYNYPLTSEQVKTVYNGDAINFRD